MNRSRREVGVRAGGGWRAARHRLRFTPGPTGPEMTAGLDLADQVQRRSQGLGAFLPLGRADLARIVGHELCSGQLAQRLGDVAGDGVVVDFQRLDHAFRIDDEGATQGQAFFFNMHAERAGQLVGRVADQRELRLAHGRRGFVPHLVREMRVGGDDIDLGASLLEGGIVVGGVFHFGRAVEGECGRHEDQHRPLALQAGLGDFDEVAIVVRIRLERLDLGVDERH
ncbi:conserved hypothetical protein [Xanthomonas citri pv. citri]|nr:conserved hypothetical protein [Xanthomonas citri pv. citri]